MDPESHWRALVQGVSGVGPLTRFQAGDFPIYGVGEIRGFNARDYVPREHRKSIKVMGWDVQLGVAAALCAVNHAGIIAEGKRVDPTRLGVNFGAGYMTSELEDITQAFALATQPGSSVDLKIFGTEAMRTFFPLWLLKYLPNMPACHISIFCDAEGPSNSITTGDAASTQAVGEALRVIERGTADVMICGGVDGKVNPFSLARYGLLGELATVDGKPQEISRPFEKSRSGFVVGEGAAAVVLEEYEHARARGANIHAELAGYGAGCDAYEATGVHPDGIGMQIAMKNALRDAGLDAGDIDAVFAGAKSSVAGDRAESRALNAVFGNGADRPHVTSTKSMTGHISAAAGVLDAAAAVCALRDGVVPPTINYVEPDPECPANVVANVARNVELNNVMVNSGGFGGQFASLVISRCG
jgi:3-oxoacyl-[acyl-carrier-protein] synthase II